ncbi:MAG: AIPR family protein [Parabacteroides sp.]|nr:AIPR family protein [Parabacteroides sp.]
MENAILTGLVEEFCDEFCIYADEPKAYEHLINYLIVSRVQPEAVESAEQIQRLNVDDGGTFGIDGMAFFVNDNLITSKEELSAFARAKSNEVNFTFIQTKTSTNIDVGDISKFARAVQDFFQEKTAIVENKSVREQREIKDIMFKRDFAKNNSKNSPTCSLFFAFAGKDFQNETVLAVIKQERENILKSCPEIKELSFTILDSDKVINLYNENTNSLEVDITFRDRILKEGVSGVQEAYYGFLQGIEFLKLIEDEDGNLRKNIFYENVRDYLGDDNPVNSGIITTLSSPDGQQLFPLLNNGVTIIAKYIKPISGNSFIIKDYQVVNGCQTSNVLHKCKDYITDLSQLSVPVKIIYTEDSAVTEQIIKANNKQSVVPDEAFIALEQFHKQLQEYYRQTSKKVSNPLYYERRSREISNDSELNVSRQQIITLHAQIRAYVSVYLGEPHLVYSNNPTFILKTARTNIFSNDDCFAPYYSSSYIVFRIRKIMQDRQFPYKRYHNFVYYLAFLFRVFISGSIKPYPANNQKNNEIEKQKIIDAFEKPEIFKPIMEQCKKVIDGAIEALREKGEFSQIQMRYKDMSATIAFESIVRELAAKELKNT